MIYSVRWKKRAEDDLADIWLKAEDRESISRAACQIDNLLRVQPHTAGESRSEGLRVLLVAPLGATFRVYEQDRIVRVANVWSYRTRS